MTLQFRDPRVEAAYEVHERSTYMNRVRIAILICTAAIVLYLILGVWVLDEPAAVTQYRLFVCLPLACLMLASSYRLKRSFFPVLAVIVAIIMAGFPAFFNQAVLYNSSRAVSRCIFMSTRPLARYSVVANP